MFHSSIHHSIRTGGNYLFLLNRIPFVAFTILHINILLSLSSRPYNISPCHGMPLNVRTTDILFHISRNLEMRVNLPQDIVHLPREIWSFPTGGISSAHFKAFVESCDTFRFFPRSEYFYNILVKECTSFNSKQSYIYLFCAIY